MTSPEVSPEIVRFYTETINEADRLSTTADGHLELIRTQELLRRHLPPPPAIAAGRGDVAGQGNPYTRPAAEFKGASAQGH